MTAQSGQTGRAGGWRNNTDVKRDRSIVGVEHEKIAIVSTLAEVALSRYRLCCGDHRCICSDRPLSERLQQ